MTKAEQVFIFSEKYGCQQAACHFGIPVQNVYVHRCNFRNGSKWKNPMYKKQNTTNEQPQDSLITECQNYEKRMKEIENILRERLETLRSILG